jgi:5-methylcytosine-specific restriction enzyme B
MSVADRRARRLRAALEVLAARPDGLPVGEVWREVCDRVPLRDEDLERLQSGKGRAETHFRWYSVDLVKAGWLRKDDGVWSVTDQGRRALDDYPEPEKFTRAAGQAYREWDRSRGKDAVADEPTDVVIVDPSDRPVLDAAALILERGLSRGGSAFIDGRSVWSPAAARELYTCFVERPDASGADFLTKLHRQLDGCSDDAVLLTAELLTLNVLPLSNVTATAKRARIRTVLGWLDSPLELPQVIDKAFESGVFSGGVGFNVSIWKMLSLLIHFVEYWHGLAPADRRAAFDDPWVWKRIVQNSPGPNMPSQREALLYLAHPGTFLPVVKVSHKRAIRDAYLDELETSTGDVDRDLLQITLALQADRRGPIPYYDSPYVERWRATVSTEDVEHEQVARRAWLVRGSSVNGHNLVPTWLADGFVSLAASTLHPVDAGIDQAALKEAVDVDYSHRSYAARKEKVNEFHAFLTRMREGDLIATTSSGSVYLGVVSGPAQFVESTDKRSNLRRAAKWRPEDTAVEYAALPAPLPAKLSSQAEVVDLTEELSLLEELLGDDPPALPAVELVLRDADDALAEYLLIDRPWLQEVIDLLRDRRQVILYGPPGTGKTYLAQHLAWHLTDRSAVKLVQFHPSYSYEDFFEGFRPTAGADGRIEFGLKPGPFRRIVEVARQDLSTPYILIIDEINRANLAKVFGELYFLLEYRDQAVGLLYSGGDEDDFTLPDNVFLIGTMNTADRSIALVDAAMRRRFAFVSLHPADEPVRGLLGRWLDQQGLPREAAALLAALNARVPDTDFAIGPSYLMRPSVYTDGGLDRVWRTSILPLLEELHYGDGMDLPTRYGLTALRRSLTTTADNEPEAEPNGTRHAPDIEPP